MLCKNWEHCYSDPNFTRSTVNLESSGIVIFRMMRMSHTQHKLILSLCLASLLQTAECECNQCVSSHIDRFSNSTMVDHALVGYSLSSFRVKELSDCLLACIENDCRCTSFNFQEKTDEKNESHCILNYQTRQSKPHGLIKKPGYTYYDIITTKSEVRHTFNSLSMIVII